MRELPLVDVACSLPPDGLRDRTAEWRDLLQHVVEVERSDGTARLRLGDAVDLGALAALCRAEVECCPFFAFELAVTAAGSALTVRVPPDADAVLDELVGLLG